MSFILSEDRRQAENIVDSLRRYYEHIASLKGRFPISAHELASSRWYYESQDHRCPHDAWLENLAIQEISYQDDKEIRRIEITVKLPGAYHDGYIEFHYPDVKSFSLSGTFHDLPGGSKNRGHRDWLYDEFRLSNHGWVCHEIEWENSRWLIESTDVSFRWIPFDGVSHS